MRRVRESLNRWGIAPVAPPLPGPLVLAEPEPWRWVARFAGALLAGRTILLLDPATPPGEIGRIHDQLRAVAASPTPSVWVPTGGTTGRRRWARHDWETLTAAVGGYLDYFGRDAATAVCVLPLHHVSGLMTVVRAIVGGGALHFGDYRSIGATLGIPPGASLSLVPTQLGRLIDEPAALASVRRAGRILLGGAKASAALLATARARRLPLAPCYGMTETAAVVVAHRPEAFLDGAEGVGFPLPHVALEWGEAVTESEGRRLGLRCTALCHGYWPVEDSFENNLWWTSDLARMDPDGGVHILRRLDRVINSGGEKVDAEKVESALAAWPGVCGAIVFGLPDPDWGERVVAVIETAPGFDPDGFRHGLSEKLVPAERPKQWVAVSEIPRTAAGKPHHERLRKLFVEGTDGLPALRDTF